MNIENVSVSDAKELLEIYRPYVEHTAITFEYEVPSVTEFSERIINISSKYPYIKAVDEEGNILGYAYAGTFKGRRAYDWSVETTVYVKENLHKKGVGKALYNVLEEALKEKGITNMYACIACPDEEDEYLTFDSPKFHEKMGFTKIGTFHKCANKYGRWYNMIWMEKMIGEHVDNPADVIF